MGIKVTKEVEEIIEEIVCNKDVESQRQLVRFLGDKRILLTQSHLSRVLKEQGYTKKDGRYIRDGSEQAVRDRKLRGLAEDYICDLLVSGHYCHIVVKDGYAAPVSTAIKKSQWPEVFAVTTQQELVTVICKHPDGCNTLLRRLGVNQKKLEGQSKSPPSQ